MPPRRNIRLTKAQLAKIRTAKMRRGFNRLRRRPVRPRKQLALTTHNFVERTLPQTLTVANESSATGLFKQFSLSQCFQVAHYVALFEYYKINKVVVEFRYKGATTPAYANIPASSTGTQPAYAMEIDAHIVNAVYPEP